MPFTALKNCKFDREYKTGEIIQDGVIDINMIQKLASYGVIVQIPKNTGITEKFEGSEKECLGIDDIVDTVETSKNSKPVKQKPYKQKQGG